VLELTCLCGQVRIDVPKRPDFVNAFNCTLCSRNHFCGRCGSTTHFTLTASALLKFGNVQTGVNMSLADESDLVGIELRYPDGRASVGGADFGYVREPEVICQSAASLR
jgi:hypothetical protein